MNNTPKTLRPRKITANSLRAAPAKKPGDPVGSDSAADVVSSRKLYVFASLVAVMTLTSALLWAVQTAPLTPDAARSLSATDHAEIGRAHV